MTPERLESVELYAWVGEDEYGSGEIGLKQGLVPAGMIPLVATTMKIARKEITDGLGHQARTHGKKIYLCKFVFAEVVTQTEAGEPL